MCQISGASHVLAGQTLAYTEVSVDMPKTRRAKAHAGRAKKVWNCWHAGTPARLNVIWRNIINELCRQSACNWSVFVKRYTKSNSSRNRKSSNRRTPTHGIAENLLGTLCRAIGRFMREVTRYKD